MRVRSKEELIPEGSLRENFLTLVCECKIPNNSSLSFLWLVKPIFWTMLPRSGPHRLNGITPKLAIPTWLVTGDYSWRHGMATGINTHWIWVPMRHCGKLTYIYMFNTPHCNIRRYIRKVLVAVWSQRRALSSVFLGYRSVSFCTCQNRFLEYFQNRYCKHIFFLHFRSSLFIPENNFLNVLIVFQRYTFASVLYYGQAVPRRVRGDNVRPVWNYYLVDLSECNETRSRWSLARPSICNIGLEPLEHSAHDLANKSW